ncbi:MAG: DUF2227 family putative metal-binding protein [Candidatus Methanoperedens sp.]|nr:DUF2227 family putative metal-binding protein [Candidatus Methanoperedens sp.]MCZ7359646.1 DUF2227 family putative metal-binding protein [Candidatus Methanoperedens sp.]HLB70675.1 DUF2227 family putative metal-binding protein [Candidatus Methanoperedens sp.]
MPGYNTHRIFNYSAFIVIAVLLYLWKFQRIDLYSFLAFSAGYYLGTDFITPDLDIESKAIKRWGPLKILWLPYMWIFHHGQSSHNLISGTIVRILYISLIILGIYYVLFRSLPSGMIFSYIYVYIFIIGIVIANALHVILDALF